MNSYQYNVPALPPSRRLRRRSPKRIGVALVLCAVLVGLIWKADGVESALTPVLGHPAIADERIRKADTLMDEGEKSLGATEYAGARKRFGEALDLAPTRLAAWDQANLASYLHNEAEAPTVESLVKSSVGRLQLHLALAERERKAGRVAAARPHHDAAAALDPESPEVLAATGRQLEAEGDVPGALTAYGTALTQTPDDVDTASRRFALGLRQGDVDTACREAVAVFQPLAARLSDPAVHVGLAEAYMHLGLAPEELAKRLAKDAPQLASAQRQLYIGRAHLRHYEANPNWHRDSFDRVLSACAAVKANGDAPTRVAAITLQLDAHEARADRFRDRSDVQATRVELERALRLARELPDGGSARIADLQVARAHALTLGGKGQEAIRALEAALKANPQHACRAELADLQAGLGMTLLSAGKTQAAIGHLKLAVALMPDDDGLLARYYQALGGTKSGTAVAAVAAAAGRTGNTADALAHLTHGLSQAHKPKDARAILGLATRKGVPAGRLAEIRAEVSRAEDQRTLARTALLQAIEHSPTAELWLRLGAVEAELAVVRAKQGQTGKRDTHQRAALDAYRHALAREASGPARARAIEATQVLVDTAYKAGRMQDAAQTAAIGRVLAPNDPTLALSHARALMKLSRWDDAAQASVAGLAGLPNAADPRYANLELVSGQSLRKLNRPSEAAEALKHGLADEAAAAPARCADLWFELAFAHADAKQREEALNATRQYAFWAQHDAQQKVRLPAMKSLEAKLKLL